MEANLRGAYKRNISVNKKFSCDRMVSLMPRKKKNKSAATAKKSKSKSSRDEDPRLLARLLQPEKSKRPKSKSCRF